MSKLLIKVLLWVCKTLAKDFDNFIALVEAYISNEYHKMKEGD